MDSLPPSPNADRAARALRAYWHQNLILMSVLLALWAVAGLGCGILWADWLNRYRLPGTDYPLGFWFAQQGSIIVFVILILAYAIAMNRLDRRHLRKPGELAPESVEDVVKEGRA